jgi:hypothetical protein
MKLSTPSPRRLIPGSSHLHHWVIPSSVKLALNQHPFLTGILESAGARPRHLAAVDELEEARVYLDD